jgi:1-acyl-sn-glycerol-3-phosphate acyltransferase
MIGIVRLLISLLILLGGTIFVLATFWLPLRWRRIPLAAWSVTGMARLVMRVMNVQVHCPEPNRIRNQAGFVFPNHSTYMDIVLAVHLIPMRFVAKEEIRQMPLIGLIAQAIGCVFVKRENKASRTEARLKLGQVKRYPPIVLFPEGRTNHSDELLPFRHGAFAVAIENGIPYLPCVILFDRPEIVRWQGDPFHWAVWRLASRPGPINAYLIPLEPIHPQPEDDPVQLAEACQATMAAFLAGKDKWLANQAGGH